MKPLMLTTVLKCIDTKNIYFKYWWIGANFTQPGAAQRTGLQVKLKELRAEITFKIIIEKFS